MRRAPFSRLSGSDMLGGQSVLVWTPASKVVPAKAGTQTMCRAPFGRVCGSDMPGLPMFQSRSRESGNPDHASCPFQQSVRE
jgi:hypothetical protein